MASEKTQEERNALNPFKMVQLSVFDKVTGKFIGCIHSQEGRGNGKWPTIGHVGFIFVDTNIHELRPATKEELDGCFNRTPERKAEQALMDRLLHP